ncbi:MAG TPA: hypothetical protein VL916_05035, partial [Ilumatobacteraceae bacterium]|nr:hypothetical protein [Ilumatobacteraceae bacterium]
MSDLQDDVTNASTDWSAVGPPVPVHGCALVVDHRGAIVATNGAIRRTIGAGRQLLSIVPTDTAGLWQAALTAAARGRATAGLPFDDRGTSAEVHPWRGGAVVYPVAPVPAPDDGPDAEGFGSIVEGLQRGVIEELDRFRDVVAVLDEAIYVYAPIFDEREKIVDLRVVEQNPAAIAQPRSTVTQINTLASEAFRDPELAIAAAREAWHSRRAEPYLLSIPGDDGTTVHYEISTLRAGNLLVQISADRTSERAVVEARERYRRTLESLEQAVVAFTPVWHDGRIVDATIEYVNRTALLLVPSLPQWPTLAAVQNVGPHLIAFVAEVATTGVPRQVLVDNTGGTAYPLLVAELMELAFYPDGDRVIAVATDRTLLQNAERVGRETRALLEQGIASLVEPFLVFEPIFDDDGTIVDAHLAYANEAATTAWTVEVPLGDRLSSHWTPLDIFLTAANEAWTGNTARYRLDTFTEPMPEMLPTVDDVTIVRAAERLVMTSNNRTAEMQALRELAASEVLFRTTADALVQQTHVHRPMFDDHGELVDTLVLYANPAAEAALPEHRPHAGKRGTELFDNFDEFFELLYVEAWRHPDRPASIVVDHLNATDLQLPSTYLEVQARRVGDQIVTVAVDRTIEMRAMREL